MISSKICVQKRFIFQPWLLLALAIVLFNPISIFAEAIKIRATGFAVRDMVEDSNGIIWIATFGNGLWKYDHGRVSVFAPKAGPGPFPMISNLLLDKNRLWLATAGGGCVCLNLATEMLEPVEQALGFEKLHGLLKTSAGEMIIGAVGSGTATLVESDRVPTWESVAARPLQHLSWVNDIAEWQGKVWLATACGLYYTPADNFRQNWDPRSASLGEGANCMQAYRGLLYIGTTTRGVFALKSGKQPYPIRNTYGEIYFLTKFKDLLIAGGQFGLWTVQETTGKEVARFPELPAKSQLVTKNNTLLIGTMDGRIIETEDLQEFKLLLNLQQHGPEEPADAK